jgi:phosphatidylglycerol:prolipoprotein diacylglycerol transferase
VYPIIRLAEGLEIPSFFLNISLVISLSLFWIIRRGDLYHLPKKNILDLSLLLMGSSLVGARFMHILYENFSYYQEHPLRVFYLWQGGFVFYGGLVLAFVTTLVYLKWLQTDKKSHYFDAFAPVLAFAYGFGRIGCFLAGCCYGKTCEYPWAMNGRHPAQLYAFFLEVGIISLLLGIEKVPLSKRPRFLNRSGDIFVLWLALHSLGRLMMESFRDDFRGDQILGQSVSTILSLLLFLISSVSLYSRKPT